MKTKSELLLYRLSWTFDVIMSPTWRNLNDSFESWAYRNGCLRQIQSLEAHEFVESMPQVGEGGNRVYRLTELGMLTALGGRDPDVEWSRKWDEQWRMVIFDVPETARHKREVLRMALRKLHFGCLQRSVWISPHPVAGVEHEMKRLKVDAASLVLIDGKTCAGETATDLVDAAWDFRRINRSWERLEEHLATFPSQPGVPFEEELARWSAEELTLWKTCAHCDPLLPKVLHPGGYQGPRTWKLRRKVLAALGKRLVAARRT